MPQQLLPMHVQKISKRYRFRVSFKGQCTIKIKEVLADSYEQAATIAARRVYGRLAFATRVWGMEDFSGYFQSCYNANTGRGKETRLLGEPFHLQMLANPETANSLNGAYQAYNGLRYIRKRSLI